MCDEVNKREVQQILSETLSREINERETGLLIKHLSFVLEQNKKMNLTRIIDKESGVILHIEDSLTALQEIDRAPSGKMVDLGSGGGFPGIPLAIVTGRETTLVESTSKKAKVLEEFIQSNDMNTKIEVAAMRIEELSLYKKNQYMVATARALSSLTAILELASPLLMIGGLVIAYKGRLSEVELESAIRLNTLLGMELLTRRKLILSDGKTRREIIVFKKIGPAQIQLPRRVGQAQKNPLSKREEGC